jgi:hypothetical protein
MRVTGPLQYNIPEAEYAVIGANVQEYVIKYQRAQY